jgi:uncharacterized protein (TIGR03546 family)
MFSFINIPARVITILELNLTPRQIAGGVCLGMFMGFVPLNGPAAILLFIFFFLFKINRHTTVITLPIFKLFYVFGVSAITEKLGGYLLIDADFLSGFWSFVTGLPVIALLDLNNTLIAGGFAFSAVLCVPVYFISKFIYTSFLEKNIRKLQNYKFAQRFAKNKIVTGVIKKADKIRNLTE